MHVRHRGTSCGTLWDHGTPPTTHTATQVMDLIVNAPVKSGIRRERCEQLFDYFQNWKIQRLEAQDRK